VLDDLGVVPAIRSYIENYTEHYGITVHFECNLRKRLEASKETTIYRVIQEALKNIGKYADVAEAQVIVKELDSNVEVHILDEGKGFTRKSDIHGVGLFSMEERARSVGGKIDIYSEPGKGTKVTLLIPK
jgi:two-component system sensor histidine kinase NreB